MCTYNGAEYIREQLDSILAQTLKPDEIIIQDDGSTDDTIQILREYTKRDRSISIFQNDVQLGVNNNFYSALDKATGDYIAISDQDDLWDPQKLQKQYEAIRDNEHWLCFHLSFQFYGNIVPNNIIYDNRMPNFGIERILFKAIIIQGHTMFFKKELWLEFKKRMKPEFRNYFIYDNELAIVASLYGNIVCLPECLVLHRRTEKSVTFLPQERSVKYQRSLKNGLAMLFRNISFSSRNSIKPLIRKRFEDMYAILNSLDDIDKSSKSLKKLIYSYLGKFSFIKFPIELIKNRHRIFYTSENNEFIAVLRSILFNIQVYDYFR